MWVILRKPQYTALLVIAVMVAVGCSLAGVWQIHRYNWKRDTNTTLRDNNKVAPVPIADLMSTTKPTTKAQEFRRITATGHYETTGQLLVRNRQVNDNPAYLVLTPFRTTNGPLLLLTRGWVHPGATATANPKVPPPPTGQLTITARIYPTEPAGKRHAMPTGQVERINVPAISKQLGGNTYGGYAELITASSPSALPKLPSPDMSNPAGGAFQLQHLAYVGQWFIFAMLALAAPFILARIERRRLEEDDDESAAVPQPSG